MIRHQQMYLLSALVIFIVSSCCAQSRFEKVLLQNVDSIVLREGQLTNSRRVSPIPQLRCVGGSAGCSSTPRPNLVICSNIGSQRQDVRWECEADFDQRYKFGRIQVSCEGYEHSDDPYILKDSCGLEYEIDYEYSQSNYQYNQDYSSHQSSWLSFTNIFLFAAIGILIYAIYQNSLNARATDTTGTHTEYTPSPSTPTGGTSPGHTGGFWSNFLGGMFVGGIANSIFSMFTSPFRGYGRGYGSGYGRGYGSGYGRGYGSGYGQGYGSGYGSAYGSGYHHGGGGMSGWGGGARGWGGSGSSSGGGSTSRKSAFGGTSKR